MILYASSLGFYFFKRAGQLVIERAACSNLNTIHQLVKVENDLIPPQCTVRGEVYQLAHFFNFRAKSFIV